MAQFETIEQLNEMPYTKRITLLRVIKTLLWGS